MSIAGLFCAVAAMAAQPGLLQAAPVNAAEEIAAAIDGNRLVQAEQMLSRARSTGEWSRQLQVQHAHWLHAAGRYDEALSAYLALSGEVNSPELSLGIGLSALRLNRLDVAEKHLRAATSVQPSNWRGWNGLGILLDRTSSGGGEHAYRSGLRVAPESVPLWNNLGYSLFLQGKFDDAEDALQQALRLRPENEVASRNLDIARAAMGVFPTRAGDSADIWAIRLNNAGYGAWVGGRLSDARALFARAILERETHFQTAERNLLILENSLGRIATP